MDLSKLTSSGCQKSASGQAKKMLGFAKGGACKAKGGAVKESAPKKAKPGAGPAAKMMKTEPRPAPGPLKRAMGGAGKYRKSQADLPKKGKK